jgi:TM2 domain-containing membrane protein YozV
MQFMPDIEGNEMVLIQNFVKDWTDEQTQQFVNVYRARRKDPQTVLIMTLIGLVGVAGIQRFYTDQIGMGILYFFTGGLCVIGTIVDLVNYKNLAFQYNQNVAMQVSMMMKSMNH